VEVAFEELRAAGGDPSRRRGDDWERRGGRKDFSAISGRLGNEILGGGGDENRRAPWAEAAPSGRAAILTGAVSTANK